MSAIGPGDWVECVDASPHPNHKVSTKLVQGALYRVREESVCPETGKNGLTLCGVLLPIHSKIGREIGWLLSRFRPIYRPKADLIESLKTPAKRERVPA